MAAILDLGKVKYSKSDPFMTLPKMKMIPRKTTEILPKMMKIGHNLALKAAILDFGKGQIFPK